MRVNEGTRTPDLLGHNQALYQLSYEHHVAVTEAISGGVAGRTRTVLACSASGRSTS